MTERNKPKRPSRDAKRSAPRSPSRQTKRSVKSQKLTKYTVYAVVERAANPDVWLRIGMGFDSHNGKAIHLVLNECPPVNARIVLVNSDAQLPTIRDYLVDELDADRLAVGQLIASNLAEAATLRARRLLATSRL